ncbi:DUF4328 domain-containing protein [Streptomyces sp. NBC_01465]|uniref:DUF4328 domain-containing protein n=1 Tax=Streptomyces sp. NBC_01465 TaxID=2903878 RepID=UPI002E36E7AC|nr:DUF4328 domain-containing protein [Streptomyces sp. NBC_01465]
MSNTPAFIPPAGLRPVVPVLKSPQGLATGVTVLLALCAVADLVAIASHAYTYSLLGDWESLTLDEARRSDRWAGQSASYQFTALFVTAVVFVIWFHRVRVNAEVFAQDSQTKRAGWAVGGWFIPFGCLWIPRQIAGEVWDASTQAAPDGSRRKVSQAPVTIWWTAWVLAMALRALASVTDRAEIAGPSQDSVGVLLVADSVHFVAAVLAILFVRKLTRMQNIKATQGPRAAA